MERALFSPLKHSPMKKALTAKTLPKLSEVKFVPGCNLYPLDEITNRIVGYHLVSSLVTVECQYIVTVHIYV